LILISFMLGYKPAATVEEKLQCDYVEVSYVPSATTCHIYTEGRIKFFASAAIFNSAVSWKCAFLHPYWLCRALH
jgi:CO dehydrogenase/acetyl-CoA synthase alpha subunit